MYIIFIMDTIVKSIYQKRRVAPTLLFMVVHKKNIKTNHNDITKNVLNISSIFLIFYLSKKF